MSLLSWLFDLSWILNFFKSISTFSKCSILCDIKLNFISRFGSLFHTWKIHVFLQKIQEKIPWETKMKGSFSFCDWWKKNFSFCDRWRQFLKMWLMKKKNFNMWLMNQKIFQNVIKLLLIDHILKIQNVT